MNETEQHPAPPNEGHDWNQAQRDSYKRLRERAEQTTPPAWMPGEPGDELFGTLVDVKASVPTRFGPAPVVTIQQPSGEPVSVWLLHSVLRREFERARPAIGENLLIRYLGTVQPDGGGSAYESYSLTLDREGQPAQWTEIQRIYDPGASDDPAGPAPDLPPAAAPACELCGYAGNMHADGCPNDIPF